ncbi:hypothetical protein MNB_SM-7-381 [hydrothermal vent metagenome]|uniref:Uncharacterized protein n=1 Tax=hydrothermal vent metagenome TaxID=652676 RepID=A0A1W1BS41_9ZZZZ
MQDAKAIKTLHYLSKEEIDKLLEKVEYIIMAAPSPDHFKDSPIHFTIFLNTQEELPEEIKDAVLEKFLNENSIQNPQHVMSQLAPVGFATTKQSSAMPMLLVQPQDIFSIPHKYLHVIDFLGDSDNFEEVKRDSLTGWSYVYEEE